MPYSRTKPPVWAPNAVPTSRGWESPDGELLIAMGGNPALSRLGVGAVAKCKIYPLQWTRNINCGIVVKFNDYVNVVAGASIRLQSTGSFGDLILYAASQLNSTTILFDRKSDMQMATVPNQAARYTLPPQSLMGTITDADGDGNTSKVISVAQGLAAGRRDVV